MQTFDFFQSFQPLMAIATTPQSAQTLYPLCKTANITLWVPELWPHLSFLQAPQVQVYERSLRAHLDKHWQDCKGIIFGLAMGATIRLIAPLLDHKSSDPAIVVVDALGKVVISACGGHQGRADQLTQGVAAFLNATPILTGASNGQHWPGLDTLGIPLGWQRGDGDWTRVSALLAQNQPIRIRQSGASELWRSMLPADHPLIAQPQDLLEGIPAAQINIGIYAPDSNPSIPTITWHPKVLWVGIGCERGSSRALIATAIQQALDAHGLDQRAIAGIASLDLKKDEVGLLQICDEHAWPLRCFDASTLSKVVVPNPSQVVAESVHTPSVAEAAALTAAQAIAEFNCAEPKLIHPKQVVRLSAEPGAVTVAIAQAPLEWIGRPGCLYLIGCGPGDLSQMTPAAQSALSQADVVIGYSLYLDLVRSRFRPGQLIEGSPITQERQRAQRAILLAQWGLTVAVISSGDSGIYGMAGLVMEDLEAQGWNGCQPRVEIMPGISALQAAASRVGTPLMHDFCAISLSDLLTPWSVIEQRLEAAAAADFITALYNPKSKTRQTHLAQAQNIFLRHRDPQTPVAIVRSAYRSDEFRQCSTLQDLHLLDVDMLTLVLIGNQSTRIYNNWMITPRGYRGFR